jgi:hypothetical protein
LALVRLVKVVEEDRARYF